MGKLFLIQGGYKTKMTQIPFNKEEVITLDAIEQIGDKLGVDWNSIDLNQLVEGTQQELEEHPDVLSTLESGVRTALAHLKEIPDYYTRLRVMEGEVVQKGEFAEEQHPRSSDGKFTAGGGEGSKENKENKENRPEPGKQYALTGGKGQPSIAGGNTWKESEVKPVQSGGEVSRAEAESKANNPATETQADRLDRVAVARTIVQQLGGGKFLAMTGAKNFVASKDAVHFSIPKAKDSINRVTIKLNAMDTYDVGFHRVIGSSIKEVKSIDGIYNDQLQEVFTRYTGLDTHL